MVQMSLVFSMDTRLRGGRLCSVVRPAASGGSNAWLATPGRRV